MAKVIYRGNPGYVFAPEGREPFSPVPGETIELPAEVLATLGDEFEPVEKPKAEKADKVDPKAVAAETNGQEG